MSKYDPLQSYLRDAAAHTADITLTFQQVEDILRFDLPRSAHEHRAWWANPS